jgi:hypothetical protein
LGKTRPEGLQDLLRSRAGFGHGVMLTIEWRFGNLPVERGAPDMRNGETEPRMAVLPR